MSPRPPTSRPSTSRLSRRAFLAGAVGAASLGAAAPAAAQEDSRRTIDMTDSLLFRPESLTVAPGTTVVWENVGSVAHSVTAYEDDVPDDAAYFASGGFDSEDAARRAYPDQGAIEGGGSYEHTFETVGTYEYFCIPHESAGMVGTIRVTPGGAQDEGFVSLLPDSAKTLAVAATAVFLAVLGLGYFFMKYGGDYGPLE